MKKKHTHTQKSLNKLTIQENQQQQSNTTTLVEEAGLSNGAIESSEQQQKQQCNSELKDLQINLDKQVCAFSWMTTNIPEIDKPR